MWLFSLLCVAAPAPAQPSLPAGFDDALVASVGSPTSLAFTPDGRLLITTQPGRLRGVRNDALVASAALDLGTVLCTDSERGLLGVAVDPRFASNRTIYLYYTYKKSGVCERNTSKAPVNRVSRFRVQAREDGLSMNQIVLSPSRYLTKRPGLAKADTTIVPK